MIHRQISGVVQLLGSSWKLQSLAMASLKVCLLILDSDAYDYSLVQAKVAILTLKMLFWQIRLPLE